MISVFSQQTALFLQSIVLGMIFAMVYDFFRAIRREFRLRFVGTLVCDTFFWIVNLILFLLFILNFANSEGRMYIIFAIILGNTLYFLSLSSFCLKFFCYVFRMIRKVFLLSFFNEK